MFTPELNMLEISKKNDVDINYEEEEEEYMNPITEKNVESEPEIKHEDDIECCIDRTIFHAQGTGMTIYAIRGKKFTLRVNSTEVLTPGTVITAVGEWSEYKGRQQYVASGVFEKMPDNTAGVLFWHQKNKDALEGIGESTFRTLFSHFKNKNIGDILSNSDLMSQVIPQKKADLIAEVWIRRDKMARLEMDMRNSGMKAKQIVKIIETYKEDPRKLMKIANNDPWEFIKIDGIGFGPCDSLARRYNLDMKSSKRIQAGFEHVISSLTSRSGDCGVKPDKLIMGAISLLGLDADLINKSYKDMIKKQILIFLENVNLVYPSNFYNAEQDIIANINRLISTWSPIDTDIVITEIERAEKELGVKLDRDGGQMEAAIMAVQEPVCIITGGPGTGKSTTQNVIVRVLENRKKVVSLAALMGKAAKRLGEVTGKSNASTIHRLLNYRPGVGFSVNRHKPLLSDVVIVDEFSTTDLMLASALFKGTRDNSQIIIVGDVDQLPSVGPGQVLRDMIESEVIPVSRLTRVHRQVNGSEINTAITRINHGEFPVRTGERLSGFEFIETTDKDIKKIMSEVIADRIAQMGYDPVEDVQILMGYKIGGLGTVAINEHVKTILNPSHENDSVTIGDRTYTVGDRVMQLKNDAQYGVFNGEIGVVTSVLNAEKINERQVMTDFEGKSLLVDMTNAENMALSYAGTIHKSQGSEYPFVVVVVPQAHANMLTKNLIYTAVSRGKMDVIMIGSKMTMKKALERVDTERRHTALKECLIDGIKKYTPEQGLKI